MLRRLIAIIAMGVFAFSFSTAVGQIVVDKDDLTAVQVPVSSSEPLTQTSPQSRPQLLGERFGSWEYRPCKVDMVETFYYDANTETWTGSITSNQNESGVETISYDIIEVAGHYERSVSLDGFTDPEGFVAMLDASTVGLNALVKLEDVMAVHGVEVDEFSIEYAVETDTWSTEEVMVDNPVNLSNGTTVNTYDMMYSFRFLPLLGDSEEGSNGGLDDGLRTGKVTVEMEVEVKVGPNVTGRVLIKFEGTPEEAAEAKEMLQALMADTVDLTMEEVKQLLAQLLEWIKNKHEEFSEKLARWWYNNFLKE